MPLLKTRHDYTREVTCENVTHAEAFEPMPAGNPFGDVMNAPKKYVVSRTLDKPVWRDTTVIRDDVIESVRAPKAQSGQSILTDGSSQLVHALLEHDLVDELHLLGYPLMFGSGKRLWPDGVPRPSTYGPRRRTQVEWWRSITCVSADSGQPRDLLSACHWP
jgi:dihydrofolate reductase